MSYTPGSPLNDNTDYDDDWFEVTPDDDDLGLLGELHRMAMGGAYDLWNTNERYNYDY